MLRCGQRFPGREMRDGKERRNIRVARPDGEFARRDVHCYHIAASRRRAYDEDAFTTYGDEFLRRVAVAQMLAKHAVCRRFRRHAVELSPSRFRQSARPASAFEYEPDRNMRRMLYLFYMLPFLDMTYQPRHTIRRLIVDIDVDHADEART